MVGIAGLVAACTAEPEPVTPAPHHWVGEDGRTVLYRGVNLASSAKRTVDNHHDLSAAELALLPAHGVTLARYLLFWQALEPAEGVYDLAYLAQVRADLDALDALDVDVVLDLHQDLYGEGFGSTGFPTWTCDQAIYDRYTPDADFWFLNYLDPAMLECFDAFWASDELQAAYAQMVAMLVAEVGDHPAVVGLDVINEPFWGSLDIDEHDGVVLPRFYAGVLAAVRTENPTLRLFLAPSVAANLEGATALDLSSLDDPHLGTAPHFYPTYAELGSGWDGTFADEATTLGNLADHARAQGVPMFLGEYGIFSAAGNEDAYVRAVTSTVEAAGGSTAYWSYDHDSNLLTAEGEAGWLLPVLGEPYAHRIPGRLQAIDEGTVVLTLIGEGTLTWVAPDPESCAVVVEGGEVVETQRAPGRVHVLLTGLGEIRARLDCTTAR